MAFDHRHGRLDLLRVTRVTGPSGDDRHPVVLAEFPIRRIQFSHMLGRGK